MSDQIEQVKGIIDTDLDDLTIERYIEAAERFINAILKNSGIDIDVKEEIIIWVTAHLITVTRDRQVRKEGAGGAFIEYVGSFAEGLQSSTYGQTAILMDPTNKLRAAGKQNVQMRAL